VSRSGPQSGAPPRSPAWYADASDAALLKEAADADDDRAFETLVVRYRDRLFTFALRLLGSHDEAYDAVQEALISAWRGRSAFRGEAKVSTWLFTITRRKAFDRSGARDPALLLDELPEPSMDGASGLAERSAARMDVLDALRELPAEFREVAVMADVLGMPLAEIAAITGAPENTVKTRLFRARGRLAATLRGEVSAS
jgi:RNA polymerase sigma-70 factor (ECF subfamily)